MAESPALPSFDDWHDEFIASDTLFNRLYRADEQTVRDVIAPLTPHQRAGLAAFCYRRSHLHPVGLIIAATCDQLTLIQVLGTAVGTVLFNQSREGRARVGRPAGAPRSKITLARRRVDAPLPQFDLDETDLADAAGEGQLEVVA